MASSSALVPLFLLSSLSTLLISLIPHVLAATISIPLSSFPNHSSSDPYQILNNLATASLHRARHLKHRNTVYHPANDAVRAPLYVRSYGGYSVSLRFGGPPQTISCIFDTGSSLVWVPCTSRYVCVNCNFPNVDPARIPRFIPKDSSTSQIIGCQNPKCSWIFGKEHRCRGCDGPEAKNCTKTCPAYLIQYGLGATAGILLSDSLDLPGQRVPDFTFGCSILSDRQPEGIAGFGRGPESLPSQMRLRKFSHCLISRRFDDSPVSSDLVLETEPSGGSKTPGLVYTPFRQNPNVSNAAFQDYYYVTLRRIIVGGQRMKIPYKFLVPHSPEGNGGTIIDSGSTFTFMEAPVFDLVAKSFETQMSNYSRAVDIEKRTGLRPCFRLSGEENVDFPSLVFQFKGGAKMKLPLTNYFALIGGDVACLMLMSDDAATTNGVGRGPAIILGSFQQQNYLIEYDLENGRLGFGQRKCA